MLLLHRERGVPAIANHVDKQRVGNLPFDGRHIHDVVAIPDCPALNAGTPSQFAHDNAQEVAAAFAFFRKLGAQIVRSEAGPPEGLAAQPELDQLFTIARHRRVATDAKQRCVNVGCSVKKGKATGGEEAIVE